MADVQLAPIPAHEMVLPKELPSLRSNQGKTVDHSATRWMQPTTLSTPIEEIRARFKAEGYVWIKGLIPREDVYDMREQYLQVLP